MKKGVNDLIKSIEKNKKGTVGRQISQRTSEFSKLKCADKKIIFSELCFCILTANCSAESCINVQREVDEGFMSLTEKKLAGRLKKIGYRFPNKRADYIVSARQKADELMEQIDSKKSGKDIRDWLAENIKGLGMKEASHFLRNIGFGDVAIIDFHIIDILVQHGVIREPKTMTKKKYVEIEKKLEEIAKKTNLSLGELDLYLWYAETGKILK
jgi:N-glycosylase/DNA lyase